MEDVIPWQYTEMLQHITAESPTPILTGEDIYLSGPLAGLRRREVSHAPRRLRTTAPHPSGRSDQGSRENDPGWRLADWPAPVAITCLGLMGDRGGGCERGGSSQCPRSRRPPRIKNATFCEAGPPKRCFSRARNATISDVPRLLHKLDPNRERRFSTFQMRGSASA
jgi:hypothetical protein